jgi:Zn-dependent peptidase ImmA (M78 family)
MSTSAVRRFDPRCLKYDSDWVPVLSKKQVEDVATELLENYCPQILKRPGMTPVMEIISKLKERTGLEFGYGDLGSIGGLKILGKVSFSKKTLWLDRALTSGSLEKRLQFTAAHEIGHWVLHRHSYHKWKFSIGADGTLDDDEESLCKLIDMSPRDWLEVQANIFAAELIMPKATFEQAVAEAQWEIGIRRNVGLVWLNGTLSNALDRIRVLEKLEMVYSTSKQAIDIRLESLGLIARPKLYVRTHEAANSLGAEIIVKPF